MVTEFKIALVGEGGVGKTAWINRFRTGEFERKWVCKFN
jgi:GTPase SAR1 family protein